MLLSFHSVLRRILLSRILLSLFSLALVFSFSTGCLHASLSPIFKDERLHIYEIPENRFPKRKLRQNISKVLPFPELNRKEIESILGFLRYRSSRLYPQEGQIFYPEEVKDLADKLFFAMQRIQKKHRFVLVSRYVPASGFMGANERNTLFLWNEKDGINFLLGEIRTTLAEQKDSSSNSGNYLDFFRRLTFSSKANGWYRVGHNNLKKKPYEEAFAFQNPLHPKKLPNKFPIQLARKWAVLPLDQLDKIPDFPKTTPKSPAKEPSDKELPTKEPSDKESPVKEASDKESSAKEPSDKDLPVKEASDKESSAKEPSDKESPAKEASDKESPAKEASDKESSAKEPSDKESSEKEASDKDLPAKEPSGQEPSAKNSFIKVKPPFDKELPVKEASDQEPSVKNSFIKVKPPFDKESSEKEPSDKESSN